MSFESAWPLGLQSDQVVSKGRRENKMTKVTYTFAAAKTNKIVTSFIWVFLYLYLYFYCFLSHVLGDKNTGFF
jgi:hypothetical protein